MVQRFHVLRRAHAAGTEQEPVRRYGIVPQKDRQQRCVKSGRLQKIFWMVTERAVEQLTSECATVFLAGDVPAGGKAACPRRGRRNAVNTGFLTRSLAIEA